MRHIIVILITFSFSYTCFAQTSVKDPVIWQFSTIKKSETIYEVWLTARIKKGWHIYAQEQPEGAIALPTVITFRRNPLLTLEGRPKVIGKIEKTVEPILAVEQFHYSNKVDFVQTVHLKSKAETTLIGAVTFMACTDEECLPQKQVAFRLPIKE